VCDPRIQQTPLCRHPSTASFLMSKGSNPCVADREGAKMAIHYACLYGHWSCAQVMMESRWVVQNPDGLRPLAQVRCLHHARTLRYACALHAARARSHTGAGCAHVQRLHCALRMACMLDLHARVQHQHCAGCMPPRCRPCAQACTAHRGHRAPRLHAHISGGARRR
jgi:hypothetical protein